MAVPILRVGSLLPSILLGWSHWATAQGAQRELAVGWAWDRSCRAALGLWRRRLAQRLQAERCVRARGRTLVRGALHRWHGCWQSESGPGSGPPRLREGPGLIRATRDFVSSRTESGDGTSTELTRDGEGQSRTWGRGHCEHCPSIPRLCGPYTSHLTSPNLSLLSWKMGSVAAPSSGGSCGDTRRPSLHSVWLRTQLLADVPSSSPPSSSSLSSPGLQESWV